MKYELGYASAWTPTATATHTTRKGVTRTVHIEAHLKDDEVSFTIWAEITEPDGSKRPFVPLIPYTVFEELRGRRMSATIKPERRKARG